MSVEIRKFANITETHMNINITFQNLPFTPESNQVIYIENHFNEQWNALIQDNYEPLKRAFHMKDRDFVYLPKLLLEPDVEEKVRYYAPYLSSQIVEKNLVHSTLLLKYLQQPELQDSLSPTLIYSPQSGEEGTVTFSAVTLDELGESWIDDVIKEICPSRQARFALSGPLERKGRLCSTLPDEEGEYLLDFRNSKAESYPPEGITESVSHETAEESCPYPEPKAKKSSSALSRTLRKLMGIISEDTLHADEEDEQELPSIDEEEEMEITQLIETLQETAERLKLKGITLAAVHELIDLNNPLSRLVITDDFRILLPDYHVEVKMKPISKAVFFLFLNHPEGIRLKELPDYYKELYNYYRQCQTRYSEPRMRITITELCNSSNNKINEVISRINCAFRKEFDDHLAKNYYVSGNAGGLYGISLDRELIEWEE